MEEKKKNIVNKLLLDKNVVRILWELKLMLIASNSNIKK